MGEQRCPFAISVEEADASSEEHAHYLLLKTDKDLWCLEHKYAYSTIRKAAAVVGKRLLVAMIKLAPTCGDLT